MASHTRLCVHRPHLLDQFRYREHPGHRLHRGQLRARPAVLLPAADAADLHLRPACGAAPVSGPVPVTGGVVDVSVVICTFNRANLLAGALEALRAQQVRPGCAWDIIVVDNNSRDATRQVVERFQRIAPVAVAYVFEPRQGKSYALNAGLAATRGHLLAFTDDDCRPTPSWIDDLGAALDRWKADGIGGRILPQWSQEPPVWLAADRHLHELIALLDEPSPRHVAIGPREIARGLRIWGSNMAFRRSVLDEVGGFNTGIGPRGTKLYRGTDVEFVRRVVSAGRTVVFDPTPVVRHVIGSDRMVKGYFRRLAFDSGEGAALYHGLPPGRHVLGVFPYVLKVLARHGVQWVHAAAGRDDERFCAELQVREDLGSVCGYMKDALRNRRYLSLRRA
jgi:glucosyl-dolichyl phosphate glucuronosyltransferase